VPNCNQEKHHGKEEERTGNAGTREQARERQYKKKTPGSTKSEGEKKRKGAQGGNDRSGRERGKLNLNAQVSPPSTPPGKKKKVGSKKEKRVRKKKKGTEGSLPIREKEREESALGLRREKGRQCLFTQRLVREEKKDQRKGGEV